MKAKTSQPRSPVLLRPCDPETLQEDIQEIQLAIARRAFELFEARSHEHGHDWEDWFQAQSELLRPVSIAVSETADRFSIRANVLGFSQKELKVGVEPTRVAILGRKRASGAAEAQETPAADSPAHLLQVVDLSSEIDPRCAVVELQSGVLRFELSKVGKPEAMAVGAGQA